MKASVGRIVHMVLPGSGQSRITVPAMVTQVSQINSDVISATVFSPTDPPRNMSGVLYDEKGAVFTWHWPDRVS